MNRFELISQIKKYKAFNEQEEKDKYLLLEWIMDNEDAFSRENKIAHITATGWVVNKDRSKVLMVYHNIYDSWSWVGGHADGETDLLAVAMREVKEETGIKKVCPVPKRFVTVIKYAHLQNQLSVLPLSLDEFHIFLNLVAAHRVPATDISSAAYS